MKGAPTKEKRQEVLYVDVETWMDHERSDLFISKPDEEDSDFRRRMCLDPDMLQIVGLNYALDDGDARSGWVGETNPDLSEFDLLTTFWALVKKADQIVGFNILGFDLPALLTRSAIRGVAPAKGFNFWDQAPWKTYILDLFKKRYQYSSDKKGAKSLKELRRIFNLTLPPEFDEVLGMDGGSVEELYLKFCAGDEEALRLLKLYGRADVETTRALRNFWRGYFVP